MPRRQERPTQKGEKGNLKDGKIATINAKEDLCEGAHDAESRSTYFRNPKKIDVSNFDKL